MEQCTSPLFSTFGFHRRCRKIFSAFLHFYFHPYLTFHRLQLAILLSWSSAARCDRAAVQTPDLTLRSLFLTTVRRTQAVIDKKERITNSPQLESVVDFFSLQDDTHSVTFTSSCSSSSAFPPTTRSFLICVLLLSVSLVSSHQCQLLKKHQESS